MSKTTTENSVEKIVAYYRKKNIITDGADWVFIKKYKNHAQETTRDFIYQGKINFYGLYCSVITHKKEDGIPELRVVEDNCFSKTARAAKGWVTFNYCVLECGQTFYFSFTRKKIFSGLDIDDRSFIEARFKEIAPLFKFKEEFKKNYIYQFLFKDVFLITEKLENDRFTYQSKVEHSIYFEHNYIPKKIDLSYFQYNPLSYDSISPQKSEDKILYIVSNTKNKHLSLKDIGVIFKLLFFVPNSNLPILFKMIEGFDLKEQAFLNKIYNFRKNNTSHPFLMDF